MLSNQCEFLTILSKTMKQINYLAALAVTLLIGMLTSCAPKDDGPEEATLSLSATSVTIPNAGGEAQAITVTTNQVKWNAISNADWIKTTVSGNSLQIVAMPNEAGKDRAAQVLVVAGSTSEKVEVIQTAADISLEVSPETIVVPNSGASKLISVKSNSGAWTLDIDEAAQAWIKQNVFNDMIELEIAANDGEPREAKLYAKSGTLQKEITVQQAGKGAGFHTPLLTNSYPTQYQLLSYEKEQGSFLMSYSAPSAGLPSWGIPPSGAMYEFVTSCEFLPTLTYIFNYEGSYLETIQYVSTLSFEKFKETGYIEFVEKDLGYTLDKSGEIYKGTKEVTDPKGNVLKYKLLIGEAKGKAAVVFQMPTPPDPEQPKLLFPGGDFENWDAFISNLNKFGLKNYATQADGGRTGKAMLIKGTPKGNDYVFTTKAIEGGPTSGKAITFYVKGTGGKSLSLNVYTSDGKYKAYNLGTIDGTSDANLEVAANNQYTGTIDTKGEWVKVTLNISGLDLSTSGNFFALKVGKEVAYDLMIDDFTIE